MERNTDGSNINSCPHYHTILETPPKLLVHITAHIIYDGSINREDEPCGLCLSPAPSCQITLRKNKESFILDYGNSTCPRLVKFSYTVASQASPSNRCLNIPVRCPQCPKGALSVWKYNMISHYAKKHLPSQAPAEFQISDFKLEGLKMIWNNQRATNQAETRRRRTRLDISEAHSSCLYLWYVPGYLSCLLCI